jgi:proteasome lid subunit RPN8/RPN11
MIEQARREQPNECVGLLAGRLENLPWVQVIKRYPLVNELASPVEFLATPESLFQAVRDMRQEGLEIVGIYHSHPTSEPVPSKKDRERSYGPEVVNFIISLKNPEPIVRGWWLQEDSHLEAQWEVVEMDTTRCQ